MSPEERKIYDDIIVGCVGIVRACQITTQKYVQMMRTEGVKDQITEEIVSHLSKLKDLSADDTEEVNEVLDQIVNSYKKTMKAQKIVDMMAATYAGATACTELMAHTDLSSIDPEDLNKEQSDILGRLFIVPQMQHGLLTHMPKPGFAMVICPECSGISDKQVQLKGIIGEYTDDMEGPTYHQVVQEHGSGLPEWSKPEEIHDTEGRMHSVAEFGLVVVLACSECMDKLIKDGRMTEENYTWLSRIEIYNERLDRILIASGPPKTFADSFEKLKMVVAESAQKAKENSHPDNSPVVVLDGEEVSLDELDNIGELPDIEEDEKGE